MLKFSDCYWSKGLVTPRDHGFFSSKKPVIEEILKFFFANIYYFE